MTSPAQSTKLPNLWVLILGFAPVVLFTIALTYFTSSLIESQRAFIAAGAQYWRIWGHLEGALYRCGISATPDVCSEYKIPLRQVFAVEDIKQQLLHGNPDLKRISADAEIAGINDIHSIAFGRFLTVPSVRTRHWAEDRATTATRIGDIARQMELEAARPSPDIAQLHLLALQAKSSSDLLDGLEKDSLERFRVLAHRTRWALLIVVSLGTLLLSIFGIFHFRRMLARLHNTHKQLREREELLQQTAKLESIGALAGGVAHDFNNILMIISSYAQMVQDQLPENTTMRGHLNAILAASERGGSLTQQLLAFSRKQAIELRVLSPSPVISDSLRLARRLIGSNVQMKIELDSNTYAVKADPGQITQIILNLAANSRDAMPNGGVFTVRCSNAVLDKEYVQAHPSAVAGDYVRMEISDTGCGMPEEVRRRAFEPFFTTKERGKGTGLGLAMVYGIMRQCGGYAEVKSAVAQGTTFSLYFPRAIELEPVAPVSSFEDLKGRGRVLLVEDEEGIRETLSEYLRECGYEILSAANGRDALKVLNGQNLDAVITDIVMPHVNGPELVQTLKQSHPAMKVLYVSGYTEDFAQRLGTDAAFIRKPFSLRQFAAKVREVIRSEVPVPISN